MTAADIGWCICKWRKHTGKTRRLLLAGALPGLFLCWALLYCLDYYRADDSVTAFLTTDSAVEVEKTDSGWCFNGPGEIAIVFYPGAKVEAKAYAPLMHMLAEGGLDVFLVEMPFNLAFFGINRADRIMASYECQKWILGGHSLGGVAASSYISANVGRASGLVLLASYPVQKIDEQIPICSIYGDRDGVLNMESYEKSREYWPKDASETIIQGGNHAQFAAYGQQEGDNPAQISAEEQQRKTADSIMKWIRESCMETDKATEG